MVKNIQLPPIADGNLAADVRRTDKLLAYTTEAAIADQTAPLPSSGDGTSGRAALVGQALARTRAE